MNITQNKSVILQLAVVYFNQINIWFSFHLFIKIIKACVYLQFEHSKISK